MKTGKNSPARRKLINTFWWLASQAGKENCYAVIERLYKKNSLRACSMDEIKRVIDEICDCSGIVLRKPADPQRKYRRRPMENIIQQGDAVIELPTHEMMVKIEIMTRRMRMREETLKELIRKAGGNPMLNMLAAQKLIEMLKYMQMRGWKDRPHKAEDLQPEPGKKWN